MYSISGGGSGGLPADLTYHTYRVYGPRDHQLDSWDSWNFACYMNGGGKLVTKGFTKQKLTNKVVSVFLGEISKDA